MWSTGRRRFQLRTAAHERAPRIHHRVLPQEQSRWASNFITEEPAHELFQQGWCPHSCLCSQQACGKLLDQQCKGRRIQLLHKPCRISMTTANQPAIYAKLVLSKADVQGDALGNDQLEHGNEDQPDACSRCPSTKKICLATLS